MGFLLSLWSGDVFADYTLTTTVDGPGRVTSAGWLYDDFADGDINGWSCWSGSTWTVVNGAVTRTSSGGALGRSQLVGDIEVRYSFMYTESPDASYIELTCRIRDIDASPAQRIWIQAYADRIRIREDYDGAEHFLATNMSVSHVPNVWYDIYIKCLGTHIEVWRAEHGQPLELVLSSDAIHLQQTQYFSMALGQNVNGFFDNIEVHPNTYADGTSLYLSAIPESGEAFLNWTGSVESESDPIKVEMTQDMNLTAHFGTPESANLQWMQAAPAAPWSARTGASGAVYDGKMWVVGGDDGSLKNDVWSSTDGAHWTQVLANAPFTPRRSAAAIVHNSLLWIVGGLDGPDETDIASDIWNTPDGENWNQVATTLLFASGGPYLPSSNWEWFDRTYTVFMDKIWDFGGGYRSGYSLTVMDTPWYTANGTSWTNTGASFGLGKQGHAATGHAGRLFVLGGTDDEGNTDDPICYSEDGAVWSQTDGLFPVKENALQGRLDHRVTSFGHRLWLTGGMVEAALLNDVWRSNDGITWAQDTAEAPWSPRKNHLLMSFEGQLWLMGGETGSGLLNDVWYLGYPFTNISATPSAAGPGTTVSISFDTSVELTEVPVITVNNHAATYASLSGSTYTYSYTVQESDPDGAAVIQLLGEWENGMVGPQYNDTAFYIDATPPEFITVSCVPSIAEEGNNVLITFAASESLTGNPSVTVNGNPAVFESNDGLNYTYSYTVLSSDGEGYALIAISGVDLFGNNGASENNDALNVDNTPPVISSITATPDTVGSGGITTIRFTASELLMDGAAVTVNGNPALFVGENAMVYTYTYTVLETDPNGYALIAVAATDLIGHPGEQSSDSALYIDKDLPAITSFDVAPSMAKTGTSVNIMFIVSETLSENPIVTVNGHLASIAESRNLDYTYNYTVTGSDPDGPAAIHVVLNDLSGNTGTYDSTDTLTVDNTPPSFNTVAAIPPRAKQGVLVVLSFKISETLPQNPDVKVNAHPATFVNMSGLDCWYSYLVQPSDPEGAAAISFIGVDSAGNTGTYADVTALTIDNTPPTFISFAANPSLAKENTPVTITFTASETLLQNPDVNINGHTASFVSSDAHQFTYNYLVTSADADGNALITVSGTDIAENLGSGSNSDVLTVDKTPPSFLDFSANPNRVNTGDVTEIYFTASEILADTPVVTVNDEPATYIDNSGLNYRYNYTILSSDEEGMAVISVMASDVAGNTGTTINNDTLYVDRTPPVFSEFVSDPPSAKDWGVVHISFTASELLSEPPMVMVNGHLAEFASNADLLYTFIYTVVASDPEGDATIVVSGADTVGNSGESTNVTALDIDRTPPLVTISSLVTNDTSPALSGTINEPTSEIHLILAGQDPPIVNNGDGTWTLADDLLDPLGQGVHDIPVQAVDIAGNVGTYAGIGALIIDITPPVVTMNGDAEMTISVFDTFSDPGASVTDNLDPSVTVVTLGTVNTLVVGEYTLTYTARDEAGNDAIPPTRTVQVVDLTPPVLTLLGDNPLTVNTGEAYVDPGAMAQDNYDGDISDQIVVTGLPIDTALPGEYTLYYNVADSSGNAAEEITRTVLVVLGTHSADPDGDGIISLSELLRVIQFYNSNGIHCQDGTEDGYAPGAGDQSCIPHHSDYNPQDWRINLSEVLRMIQFFNSSGYHPCEGSEDGFCPGL